MSSLDLGPSLAGPLGSLGEALVGRCVSLNLWTAALLAGAIVIDRALSRRALASLRIALYAPVALRVLLPLGWSLRLASPPGAVTYLAPLSVGARSAASLSGGHSPSWYALAAVVYAAVVVLLAAHAVSRRARLSRLLADTRPVPARDVSLPFQVVEHRELGPMAVGLVSPRVVIPHRLLVAGEEQALACVLRHEAAHLRRHDAWLATAMELLAIVAWPVIPVWLTVARVRHLVELACDEAALAGADANERRRYGHALLDVAEWRSLGLAPLGAGELHFGSTLRARIEALAAQRHWPLPTQVFALCLSSLALTAACGGATPSPAAAPASGAADEDATAYGYLFEADSAKGSPAMPPAAAPPLNADGRVSPEAIQATVRAKLGALRACYDAGLRKDPKLTGIVTVKYKIGRDGVTTEAADAKSTLPDRDVVGCVAAELGRLTYPRGPGVVTVVYPIEFAP